MISIHGYGGKIQDITKKRSNISTINLDIVNKYRKQIKHNFFNKKIDTKQKGKYWGKLLKIYT